MCENVILGSPQGSRRRHLFQGVQPHHPVLHRGAHHKGDLVHVRGRLRQSSYERNGSRVYTVDLVASSFSRLAQGSDRVRASEPAREAQLA